MCPTPASAASRRDSANGCSRRRTPSSSSKLSRLSDSWNVRCSSPRAEERERNARSSRSLNARPAPVTCGRPPPIRRSAVVAALDVVEVHRAAVPVRAALHLPVELCHDRVRVRARASVLPVSACVEANTSPRPSPADTDERPLPGRYATCGSPATRRRGTALRPSPRSAGSGASAEEVRSAPRLGAFLLDLGHNAAV